MRNNILFILCLLIISSCELVDIQEFFPQENTSLELEGTWGKVGNLSERLIFQADSFFIRFEDECYNRYPDNNFPIIRYSGTFVQDPEYVYVTYEQGFSGDVTIENTYSFIDPDTLVWNRVKYVALNGIATGYTDVIARLNNTTWYKERPLTYGTSIDGNYTFYREAFEYQEEMIVRVHERNTHTFELTDSNWVRDRIIDTFYIKQHPQDYNRPSLLSSTNISYLENFGYVTKTGYFLTDNPSVMYLYPSSGVGSGYSHCVDYSNGTKYIKSN